MSQSDVVCPKCGAEFPLTKALAKGVEEELRKKYEDRMAAQREEADAETKRLVEQAERDASASLQKRFAEMKADMQAVETELETARNQFSEIRREKRALEERTKSLELEVDRKLNEERAALASKITSEVEEAHRYKDLEKEKKLADTLKQVEELKHRLEQSSQKIQGEVLELDLEVRLKTEFPFDTIEPVASGVRGADITQTVRRGAGPKCGVILWETKRTKSFSEGWISKLKADARAAKADICLLVTEAMPEDISTFGERDGVWISSLEHCVSLAHVLRALLIQTASERSLQTGRKGKAEQVYDYVISTEFKRRVEAVVESFTNLKEDLDSERRAMEKIWTKREKNLAQVLLNVAGMHGELAGLAGAALPTVERLELTQ